MRFILLTLVGLISFASRSQSILATHQFEADNITAVIIDGQFCDVTIQRGSKVIFDGIIEGNGDEEDYAITSDIRGSDLYIDVDKRRRGWDRLSRAELNLTIPDDVALRIETSSGNIRADGISGDRMDFESTSGDIELSNIRTSLEVGSTSGDIDLRNVTGSVYARSTSGDQDFEGINGEIEVSSTSGNIELAEFEGDVRAESTSGNIELERGTGGLFLKSTSGEIDGYQVTINGDAEFRATSGNIDFDLSNDLEEFSFDIQTNSGSLRVGSRSSDKSIYMRQGGFWIRAQTSSGNIKFNN